MSPSFFAVLLGQALLGLPFGLLLVFALAFYAARWLLRLLNTLVARGASRHQRFPTGLLPQPVILLLSLLAAALVCAWIFSSWFLVPAGSQVPT